MLAIEERGMQAQRFDGLAGPCRWRLEIGKWFLFTFSSFLVVVVAASMATGFPSGGMIPREAGTVVETPALCASRPECHVSPQSSLNMFGSLGFVDLPEAYVPGAEYEIGVEIVGTLSTRVYGFQLATFFQDTLGQAGRLTPVTGGVELVPFNGYQLLTHLEPLNSGVVQFRWTAPTLPSGPVVFRVASNAANGNNANTGDHIRTLDAVVHVAETNPDGDGDGVDDAVEDGAAEGGDGNGDGTPDRLQPHVASLPDPVSGKYVTLVAPPDTPLAGVRPEGTPSPEDAPLAVRFPVGLFAFLADTPVPGGTLTLRLLLPDGVAADSFFNFGPNGWSDFEFDGDTGAEPLDHEIRLHYRDGGRGDFDNSAANGQVSALGGPAEAGTLFYFPQIGLGRTTETLFVTDLVFVNTGGANHLRVDFLDSTGALLPVSYSVGGTVEGPTTTLDRDLATGASLIVRLTDGGEIRSGYARVVADRSLGATAVFSQFQLPSGVALYQAGVPATSGLYDFSVAVRVGDGLDTGLALANVSQGVGETPPQAAPANVTLRLYDSDFELMDTRVVNLPAGRHLPQFLTQFFPQLVGASDFFGSVTVASDQPLAAVTLQQTNTPTLTTFPVIVGRADNTP